MQVHIRQLALLTAHHPLLTYPLPPHTDASVLTLALALPLNPNPNPIPNPNQDDIRSNKKLNFHLYLALKKAC